MIDFQRTQFVRLCTHYKWALAYNSASPVSLQSTARTPHNTNTHTHNTNTYSTHYAFFAHASQSSDKHLRSDTNSTRGRR